MPEAGSEQTRCRPRSPATEVRRQSQFSSCHFLFCARRQSGALEPLVALAVVAAALLDPFQAAIAVGGLVGPILIEAGFHALLAFGFLRILRIARVRENCIAGRHWG